MDTRRRTPGWAGLGLLVALAVAGPLVALPLSFVGGVGPTTLALLPPALGRSVLLGVGVAAGTLVLGGALAVLVSFWDFPGRRLLDRALVLPLAMPSYVLVFVLVGQLGLANPLQSSLFDGLELPGLRGPVGAIAVLSAVLYPYVYLLGRSAFLGQSRQAMEVARTLGRGYGRAVWSVAVPLARPALAAGAALAAMEALADFGAVNLLGYQTLTDAIYRVWYGAFDEAAALQLASVLVSLALLMVVAERVLRGRARYHQALHRGDAVVPRRLHGWRAVLATALPGLLLTAVVVVPVLQLVAWSVETVAAGLVADRLGEAVLSTLLRRSRRGRRRRRRHRCRRRASASPLAAGLRGGLGPAAVGHAVPGWSLAKRSRSTVPLVAGGNRRLIAAARAAVRRRLGAAFTGTVLGLVGCVRRAVPRAGVLLAGVANDPDPAEPRRRRPRARRRPSPRAGRRARPPAVAGRGDRGAARGRRGDQRAAGDGAAAPAGPRHAGDPDVGGHQGRPVRRRGPPGAVDRRGRAAAGGHPGTAARPAAQRPARPAPSPAPPRGSRPRR